MTRIDTGDESGSANRSEQAVQRIDPATAVALRAGDLDALGALYDRYSRAVWSVALTVLGDRTLAEGATLETFARARRSVRTLDPNEDLSGWLLDIARRSAVDALRRQVAPTRGGRDADQRMISIPAVEQARETWQIRTALDGLPEEERVVVRMSHLEEMSDPEIAELLAIPLSTVRSRSRRAHRRLATWLAHLVVTSPRRVDR
jgi:RNA polymerase sigma-70 factor (ECF subfamily)